MWIKWEVLKQIISNGKYCSSGRKNVDKVGSFKTDLFQQQNFSVRKTEKNVDKEGRSQTDLFQLSNWSMVDNFLFVPTSWETETNQGLVREKGLG